MIPETVQEVPVEPAKKVDIYEVNWEEFGIETANPVAQTAEFDLFKPVAAVAPVENEEKRNPGNYFLWN